MSLLASLEEPATPVPPTPGRPLHHSFDPSLSESQSHLEEEQDKGSVSDYVRYLLDGSGAEGEVDFGRLRKELLDSSKPEASIDRDRFPNAPKSSQPIDASNAPPTPTPTSTRPISPLPNNAPCNPDVKSASTALESELLKWRISKSQWNAEIAARRASLEQVHRMIHDEETFGGGMTVVLEGLVGLKELALNGGNEDMKNGKSGENVGRGDGQGGLRRSRNNSNPGSPPNGGSPNPSLDAELEERRRQLDHERESYASLPLNRESLVSLPRDRSPPRDRSVGRQALDSRDRSIPREKSMAREKSVPRDRSLPREQATSRRTTEYSVVDREFDQHRGRNEERDRDRDNRESYENRESNSDRTRQFDRERQDRDWDYDRERDFERQRESLPPLPRSKVPQTPATATYLNSSVGSGSGQAGNDEVGNPPSCT